MTTLESKSDGSAENVEAVKTVVIYHAADLDGKLSGAICKYFLTLEGHEVTMCGWDYHYPLSEPVREKFLSYNYIYIVDLSVDGLMSYHNKIVWIDHHKTAIEKYSNALRGLRLDGVAAARLCYQYFTNRKCASMNVDSFLHLEESEPILVRLAGEHDVFLKKETDYHHYLNFAIGHLSFGEVYALFKKWKDVLSYEEDILDNPIYELIEDGRKIQDYVVSIGALMKPLFVTIHGKRFIALNSGMKGSIQFGNIQTESFDGMCVFSLINKNEFSVSLYSDTIDTSEISLAFGGGGHRGASGFRIKVSEFQEMIGD